MLQHCIIQHWKKSPPFRFLIKVYHSRKVFDIGVIYNAFSIVFKMAGLPIFIGPVVQLFCNFSGLNVIRLIMKKFIFCCFLLCALFGIDANAQVNSAVFIQEEANTLVLKGSADDMNFKRLKRLEGSYQLIVDDVRLVRIPADLGLRIAQLQQPENDVTIKLSDHLIVKVISVRNLQHQQKIPTGQTIITNQAIFLK
jgi:hypothetical protein